MIGYFILTRGVFIGVSVTFISLIGGFVFLKGFLRRRRRRELLLKRFSDEERKQVGADFPLFLNLPENFRVELEAITHVFIAEKSFEACGGLDKVTGHMKRVIGVQACLLLLNRKHDFYRKLRSILLYPSAYTAKNVDGGEDVRLGESWTTGSVILAWDSVISGGKNDTDGHHVSIHEFAHQLDQADGAADGVPELASVRCYRAWAEALSPAFNRFQKKLEKGKRTVIDPYGATNPAEFFAVLTETFYEKPSQLYEKYPEVYEQLKSYYQVDPLEW